MKVAGALAFTLAGTADGVGWRCGIALEWAMATHVAPATRLLT
jgi:hypothetical protein